MYNKACILVVLALTIMSTPISAKPDQLVHVENESANYSGQFYLYALNRAYPEKISLPVNSPLGWSVTVAGQTFYWAEGRLLTEQALGKMENYTPHPFYPYQPALPAIKNYTDEEKRSISDRISSRENSPPTRMPDFYNTIWRITNESTAWDRMKTTYFLGRKVLIHRELLDELAAIEEELTYVKEDDSQLREYITSIGGLEGYSWRYIAGTSSMSFHSYGTAIDVLPGQGQPGEIYWRWSLSRYPEWYSLPYDKRFMPSVAFIKAFEKRGFIWGGKWFYFDTIHFEYRPEILAVNGYHRSESVNPVTGFREMIWTAPGE
jgi:hypothetical protein